MKKFGAGLVWRGSWKAIYLLIALLLLDGIYQSFRDSVFYYNNYPISVITRKFGDCDIETGQQYLYGGDKNAVKFFCSLTNEWDDAKIITDDIQKIVAYSQEENIKITLIYPQKNEEAPQILISSDEDRWFPYNSNQIINFKILQYHIDNSEEKMGGKQKADEIKNYIEEFNKEQKMSKEQMSAFIKNNLKNKSGN